ncbi:MAG: glycosyltransferase family 2 protein, partial [Jannaschia sp.]
LLRRRYRMGQTHGSLPGGAATRAGRARQAVAATAKIGWCACAAIATLPSASARNRNILRGALHVGTLSVLLGRRRVSIYGSDGIAEGGANPSTPRQDG